MNRSSGARSGIALGLLSAATFGTSGSFASSLLNAGWSATSAVIFRIGIAAIVLLGPALWSLHGRWHRLRGNVGRIMVYGVFAVACAQVCFFNAVRYLPVGVALLMEYMGLVLIVVWMWAVHKQRPRRLTIAGSIIAIAGLLCVLDLTGAGHISVVGVLWGLGAAVGLAVYYVLSARGDEAVPALALASAGMGIGAITLLLLGLLGAAPLHARFGDVSFAGHEVSWLLPIAGLSLVAAVVSYVTGIEAARLLGARLASFLGLFEVVFAVLFAWLFLAQLPTLVQAVGGVLIAAGVTLVRLDELRAPAVAVPDELAAEPALAVVDR
ncbi:MAG TPA: DMT family transporter [Micromonosporaceae bacterium]